jgi:UDP-N-acetyl-D-mannosaminuronate dehydrogenase
MKNQLAEKIASKQAVVGVVGLGYVGLPLIQAFVGAGYKTLGFDVDQSKVDSLLAGKSYIGHIPSECRHRCPTAAIPIFPMSRQPPNRSPRCCGPAN